LNRRGEATVLAGYILSFGFITLLTAFLKCAADSRTDAAWYQKLGIRITILHTRFNKTVTADPMTVTAASDDLVNDYREIHEETNRFDIECADVGYSH
jgi:hypothetical protein